MSGGFSRLGVGGRLLLAFLGISGFAVVIAAASIFAFVEIGDVLDRITKERVPSALAAQEVSRQAERVVSAAPTLLTVGSDEQRVIQSSVIEAEVERLDELIRLLGRDEYSAADQKQIWFINKQLQQNLLTVDGQVRSRLIHAANKKAAVGQAQGTYDEIQQLLGPWVLVADARIAKWSDAVERTDTSTEERATADDDFKESLSWLRSLQELQLLMTSLSAQLQRMAASSDSKRLKLSGFRLALAVRKANELVAGLDPKLRPQISDLLKRFERFVVGPKSILSLRQAELANIAKAQQTLQQNAELSARLTEAVNALVMSARSDITAANEEATSVQRLGMFVTMAVVVLSLLCSILIVWLYVRRNLVARLSALSDSMLAIAGGNLKAPLPQSHGGDEISHMAKALIVFRDTAIEVEQSNLRDIEEARRRLIDAIENSSEGFAFYDPEDRLVICNTRYRQLLYPNADVEIEPGMAFETIIRTAAENGQIVDAAGRIDEWVAERLAVHRDPGEPRLQQREGGKWILVTERRTGDGGTVAVYSDITDLKQREQDLTTKSNALEQLSNQLAKYLSPQVYDSIFSGRQDVKVASTRKKLTVFFSDIAGFTETVDRLESEELTALLNTYLTEMSQIALEHGATIDKYVGDAIMIFFGDPETKGVKQDALACVRMAISMQKRMLELQKVWRASGIEKPLRCRMGIHTDYCTVGNFGSETRMDYTIIGGGVNLASRLESAGTPGKILISYETFAHVSDQIDCKKRGKIEVKGIAYPVETYEVVDNYDNLLGSEKIIDTQILQEICDIISTEINVIVSIFAQRGEIVASSMPERIGDFHEGGAKIMAGKVDSYEVTADEAAASQGMMEGVTLPIAFDGERVFCVAVAAPLEVAHKYGRIVQHWALSHIKEAKKRSKSGSA